MLELNQVINNYIDYYTTKKIKNKCKGRMPMAHRTCVRNPS
ncbi:IS3 family transposase [Fructobacillus fructosus]